MSTLRHIIVAAALAVAGLAVAAAAAQAPRPPRSELGHSVKLTILVDKVMQPEAGWHTEEWMVEEAAAAGFNVWSPRRGHDDLDEVRQVNAWCRKHGMYHMPWMRGSLSAPEGPAADGKRLVWGSGSEQPLYSPNADEFWEWTTEYIVAYARMAAQDSTLIGVFLDYENYAPGIKGGNLYDLSYDALILDEFAQARGIKMPELSLQERKPWLEAQGLHDAFSEFQIAHWRDRCRELREAVDKFAPDFQFCIYPAPGTWFMTAATYPEWATEQAPLILADASIYGRPGLWAGHDEALQANHSKLVERMAWALQQPGGPFMYAGGLDPVVKGADPEFCGRNAVMSAEATDGYWIFYEGPNYQDTHRDYFYWFMRANRAIQTANFDFWRAPRQTPDSYGLSELTPTTERPQLVLHDNRPYLKQTIAAMDLFEIHEMAGNAPSYLEDADVVLLQNFSMNHEMEADHPFVHTLREYVTNGGGLLLGHDTGWFMASPFPNVAVRGYPQQRVEAERHVINTDLVTAADHPALAGIEPDIRFSTEFYDHMIFEPGSEGEVIVRNTFGDPVYVAAEVGAGRVVFSGCYYGYGSELEGTEREVLHSVLRWLAQED